MKPHDDTQHMTPNMAPRPTRAARRTGRQRYYGALLLLVALAPTALAGPNRHVTDANVLYELEQYQEALDIYAGLAKEQPENAALQFNQGAALYQLGQLEAATDAFEAAGRLSDDPKLQALAAYNLGNAACDKAQALLQKSPEEAIETLTQGTRYFKDALAKNSQLSDAAKNLETTRRVIQQLRQQQQQQQEQQQQQQQKQDEAQEKLDELIEEQEQQSQDSQEAAEQQADPTQEPPSAESMKEQADQQEETRQKTEELADSMEEGSETPGPMDEAREHAQKAAEKQKEAEEHLKNQDPQKANEAQEEALEELKQAKETLEQNEESGEDEESKQSEENEDAEGEENSEANRNQDASDGSQEGNAGDMSEVPPPDETAQDILEQEKQQKAARALVKMRGIKPVEKDW